MDRDCGAVLSGGAWLTTQRWFCTGCCPVRWGCRKIFVGGSAAPLSELPRLASIILCGQLQLSFVPGAVRNWVHSLDLDIRKPMPERANYGLCSILWKTIPRQWMRPCCVSGGVSAGPLPKCPFLIVY